MQSKPPMADDDVHARTRRTRSKVVHRFVRALGTEELARKLERALWNWTLTTCDRDNIPLYWENPKLRYRYTTRALGLEFNLCNPQNEALAESARSNPRFLAGLPGMTPQEMWPEHWEDVYQRVAMRQLRREVGLDASTAPDGAYTCNRCKSSKTVYTSMQIRSADEPMTTFVKCLNCGKSWKD